jgi:hypothetical protein
MEQLAANLNRWSLVLKNFGSKKFGDSSGILADALLRFVLGHRLLNQRGEFFE